jgi:hypothetical protein
MPIPEKRAWFQLVIVALAIVAWLLMFAVFRSAEVSMASFALLALTAVCGPNQDRILLDERDRSIAGSASSVAFRCWFVLSIIVPVVSGLFWGWERMVPVAVVAQCTLLAWATVLIVRSVATIYMYRSAQYV